MLGIYRSLLYCYPSAYRHEFGPEMEAVFRQAEEAAERESVRIKAVFFLREFSGLVSGAIEQHLRSSFGFGAGFQLRRFHMRPQFRFPRSTVFLMCVILAGVAFAIEKAQQIQASLTGNQLRTDTAAPLILTFIIVYVAAAVGWGILFALRRTGLHRLDKVQ